MTAYKLIFVAPVSIGGGHLGPSVFDAFTLSCDPDEIGGARFKREMSVRVRRVFERGGVPERCPVMVTVFEQDTGRPVFWMWREFVNGRSAGQWKCGRF